MTKPTIIHKPVADRYAGPRERIIEFAGGKRKPDGTRLGGLIAVSELDDGTLRVEVYRCDPEVSVVVARHQRWFHVAKERG